MEKKKKRLNSNDLLKLWPWGQVEVQFHPTRRWRFDWAVPHLKIAVELDGYSYHTSRAGWLKDIEKFNEAVLRGWRVFHVTPKDLENGEADRLMQRIMSELLHSAETIFGDDGWMAKVTKDPEASE